ncbi:MAG: SIS domain-containing protein, partial [Candidatus Cloacimonetes bacterium]|nr:SIS domain-containing protein [Candidatus Cloacimonadota bacterium]
MSKLTNVLQRLNFTIPVPVFGVGCGVLGLSLAKTSVNIGQYASRLLKSLEYRGYDSTGAAFQKGTEVKLLKDVGAPSTLVKTLGIENEEGRLFCGQVRWATFGRVDKVNSQPHVVRCKKFIYGAHNGNITNTRELKNFLISEGHDVLSDNDGEMLVHTVEHYFDIELDKHSVKQQNDIEIRKLAMRNAIIRASNKTIGSFAAVIADPVTEVMYAIKAGSSLYFGIGSVDDNNFALASSDLTAILRFTKTLVDLKEGEFIEFTSDYYKTFLYKDSVDKKSKTTMKKGSEVFRSPTSSKLRAEDTELLPEFEYFMEQEINAEIETTGKLIKLYTGGSNSRRHMTDFIENEKLNGEIEELYNKIVAAEEKNHLEIFEEFANSKTACKFYRLIKEKYPQIYEELTKENFEKKFFFSSEKNTFIELIGKKFDKAKLLVAKALDSIAETKDVKEVNDGVEQFLSIIKQTIQHNRNIYSIACGSSFHAAKVGALFFNEIAGVELIPILPGDFRGQYSRSLRNHDTIIGVSQSGETKDLIDIFNDIDRLPEEIAKITIVNNLNSTLGQ